MFGKIQNKIMVKINRAFGTILTDEVIITDERKEHIIKNHGQADYDYFNKYKEIVLDDPDIIIKDCKKKGTVFIIKKVEELDVSINIVIRLVLETDNFEYKNSVMTSYKLRDKNLQKLINRNEVVYINQ